MGKNSRSAAAQRQTCTDCLPLLIFFATRKHFWGAAKNPARGNKTPPNRAFCCTHIDLGPFLAQERLFASQINANKKRRTPKRTPLFRNALRLAVPRRLYRSPRAVHCCGLRAIWSRGLQAFCVSFCVACVLYLTERVRPTKSSTN